MLVCPVRGCQMPLVEEPARRRWLCASNHSFDIARSGYVNLLQPQDRRSKDPGDTPEAVAGRRRIHDLGVTAPLLDAIADLLQARAEDALLDAGCGEGFYLGNLQQRIQRAMAWGADISTSAIDAAARRYPACRWIVANADRTLPFADASFTAIVSITARQNPAEFHRLLRRPDGRLLVAVPAPEDLQELRPQGRDRIERTTGDFAAHFRLTEHRRASATADLDGATVKDIRHAIYMPGPAEAMRLTFALDLLLFEPL